MPSVFGERSRRSRWTCHNMRRQFAPQFMLHLVSVLRGPHGDRHFDVEG